MRTDLRACFVFDIDGTLADVRHRISHLRSVPKDFDAFHAEAGRDEPISHIVLLARNLALPVVCVTGRPDAIRLETEYWLHVRAGITPAALYMRKAGDRRPDVIVKKELLDQLREDGWAPIMAFEDRSRVVAMWRDNGVPCAQVARGDF